MRKPRQFTVICINNDGYEASIETRKIYIALVDDVAEERGLIRVIDESGEDYLYPRKYFTTVELPPRVQRAVIAAA